MISFRPTEEELALVQVAKEFAEEQLRPAARECENAGAVNQQISKLATELGFTLLELPEAAGGLEMPLISQVQVLEALSWGDLAILQGLPGAGDTASVFRAAGDTEAASACLEAVAQEKNPETASFLNGLASEAYVSSSVTLRRAPGGWVLDGTSEPVRLSKNARFVVVALRDEDGTPALLVLDKASASWEVVSGDVRLGLIAAAPARLRFNAVKVPESCCVARGEAADAIISKAVARIRVLEAAKEVGLMKAALEYTSTYTAQRKAFGQEIAKFQGVSFTLADMAIETEAAKNLVWQAAVALDRDSADAIGLSLIALSRAHKSVRFVTNNAVQLLGGHGFVQDHPVEKWMRDAQAQVMLYGRERDLLAQRGEAIIGVAAEREEVKSR